MKTRVELSPEINEKIEEVEAILAGRGLKEADKSKKGKGIDRSIVINRALELVNESFWEGLVDDLTPLNWKFQQALSDPKAKKDIDKIFKNLKFPSATGEESATSK